MAKELMVTMSVHKLLSLAVDNYWRNELKVEQIAPGHFMVVEAQKFQEVVNEGGVVRASAKIR